MDHWYTKCFCCENGQIYSNTIMSEMICDTCDCKGSCVNKYAREKEEKMSIKIVDNNKRGLIPPIKSGDVVIMKDKAWIVTNQKHDINLELVSLENGQKMNIDLLYLVDKINFETSGYNLVKEAELIILDKYK